MTVRALALEDGQKMIFIAVGQMNEMHQTAKRRGNTGIPAMAFKARPGDALPGTGVHSLEGKTGGRRGTAFARSLGATFSAICFIRVLKRVSMFLSAC